jgi:hypothetical protein
MARLQSIDETEASTMKKFLNATLALLLAVSFASIATAQTTAPAAPAAAAPAKAAPMAKPAAMSDTDKKAKSKECSTEADSKGLHGKARKEFREKCKRG